MGTGRETSSFARRRALLCGAIAGALLIAVPFAAGHIERASYWPDPAPDNAGGVPTGGAVPEVRSLFSALDGTERGDTRVVCQGGESVPYRAAGAIVQSRQDVEISRTRVNRLEQKQKRLRAKGFKRKAAKVKKRLTAAKKEYKAALAREQAERERVGADYQRQLNEELAAQSAYRDDQLQKPSMQKLDASLTDAVANGYVIRPSEGSEPFSQAEADQLWDFNARLLAQCEYDEIQPAVMDSGNNDRVVVMPGLYTEPTARSQPTNDPSCDQYEEVNDRPDGMGGLRTGANTYTYVFHCPNDQNLIAVLGRTPDHEAIPIPPLDDRHGIPDEGECIRCNLQLEGSGVSADDVVVDGGDPSKGNGANGEHGVDPPTAKDVGIRADRADGFVLRNLTVRHVREHGIYPHEVDGYVLERFKVFYAEEYGTLQFTSDHGLVQDCETAGSGDAGIYPGSAPDTGEETVEAEERYNTEIRRCDMHHNAAGYSGTAANAVWVHHNDFYDNALGFTTDVFTAAGHPGFPQDSDLIEHNEFYDNNFNPYYEDANGDLNFCDTAEYDPNTCTDIHPTIPVPVGTGLWIAGGNNNELRNNHFWDNWRRGIMLFSVPDAFVCGGSPTAGGNQQHGCSPEKVSTSHRNEFHDNVMSRDPSGTPDPNGLDFWWDKFPGNQNNCWYDNVGKDGTRATITADPPINPVSEELSVPPVFLPSDCATSVGTGNPASESELLSCLANFDEGAPTPCSWFERPDEPQP